MDPFALQPQENTQPYSPNHDLDHVHGWLSTVNTSGSPPSIPSPPTSALSLDSESSGEVPLLSSIDVDDDDSQWSRSALNLPPGYKNVGRRAETYAKANMLTNFMFQERTKEMVLAMTFWRHHTPIPPNLDETLLVTSSWFSAVEKVRMVLIEPPVGWLVATEWRIKDWRALVIKNAAPRIITSLSLGSYANEDVRNTVVRNLRNDANFLYEDVFIDHTGGHLIYPSRDQTEKQIAVWKWFLLNKPRFEIALAVMLFEMIDGEMPYAFMFPDQFVMPSVPILSFAAVAVVYALDYYLLRDIQFPHFKTDIYGPRYLHFYGCFAMYQRKHPMEFQAQGADLLNGAQNRVVRPSFPGARCIDMEHFGEDHPQYELLQLGLPSMASNAHSPPEAT